jgi:hypothetical protein
MKTRIQLAGVEHGSKEGTVFNGDLPLLSGVPGMRFVLNHPEKGSYAFQFRQMCLEINAINGEYEQVIYVAKVDKTQQVELLG